LVQEELGHQSLRAMFALYFGYGAVFAIVATILMYDTINQALFIALVFTGMTAFMLIILKHESKKVV